MNFYKRANEVADQIIKAFESGNIPKALASVFIKRAGRHCDSYSWTNQLLVALAGWADTMGYGSKEHGSGWTSVGRHVKKGSKATYILAPCIRKVDDPKAPDGKRSVIYGFRAVAVFGIEQTDIVDADKWAKHNKGNEEADKFLNELPGREVATAWGLKVNAYSGRKGGAHGWYRRGDAIAVGVENLSTWAHELVHAADYRNGKLVEHGQHWRSETVAELGGAMLMMIMGYETDADLGGAYEYIKHYAETAKIDVIKACMDVVKRTCEAVALILAAIETGEYGSDSQVASTESDSQVAELAAA